jgi:hypothetical protein
MPAKNYGITQLQLSWTFYIQKIGYFLNLIEMDVFRLNFNHCYIKILFERCIIWIDISVLYYRKLTLNYKRLPTLNSKFRFLF